MCCPISFSKNGMIMIGFGLDCQCILKIGFGFGLSITYLWRIWIGLSNRKKDSLSYLTYVKKSTPRKILLIWSCHFICKWPHFLKQHLHVFFQAITGFVYFKFFFKTIFNQKCHSVHGRIDTLNSLSYPWLRDPYQDKI